MLGEFVSSFKKISYFAVFAHKKQASDQVTSKFDAWEWVKHHAKMFLDALQEAPPLIVGVRSEVWPMPLTALSLLWAE